MQARTESRETQKNTRRKQKSKGTSRLRRIAEQRIPLRKIDKRHNQPKHKQNSSKDNKYHVTTSSFAWSKKPYYTFFFMPLSMFRGPSIIERSFIIKSFNFFSPAVPFPTTPEPNP
jgi:hypothetical protein